MMQQSSSDRLAANGAPSRNLLIDAPHSERQFTFDQSFLDHATKAI